MKDKQIHLRTNNHLIQQLTELAKHNRMSSSEYIREFISDEYCKHLEQQL